MAPAYDTLETAKRLTGAGIHREQAEAIAFAIKSGQGDLATTVDIKRLEETTSANTKRLEETIQRLEEKTFAETKRLEETIQRLEEKTFAEIKRLEKSIQGLEEKMEVKMEKLEDKSNNLRWTIIAMSGLVVALVKLLP